MEEESKGVFRRAKRAETTILKTHNSRLKKSLNTQTSMELLLWALACPQHLRVTVDSQLRWTVAMDTENPKSGSR